MSATFRCWSDATLGYCCQVDTVGLKLCGGKAHGQNRFSTCWEYLPAYADWFTWTKARLVKQNSYSQLPPWILLLLHNKCVYAGRAPEQALLQRSPQSVKTGHLCNLCCHSARAKAWTQIILIFMWSGIKSSVVASVARRELRWGTTFHCEYSCRLVHPKGAGIGTGLGSVRKLQLWSSYFPRHKSLTNSPLHLKNFCKFFPH